MNRPSHILIINWQDITNPQSGGAEVHLHRVGCRMVELGIRCTLYVSRYPGSSASEMVDGMQVYRQGSRWNFNFIVWLRARSWIRRHNPDLIIDDSNKIPLFLPWLTKKPVLVRIHHLFRGSIFSEVMWPMALYVYLWESLGILCWKNSSVVTVSQSTREELQAHGIRRIALALNGVDHTTYKPGPVEAKEKYMLLYLGRLKKYKAIDTLIESVLLLKKKYPRISLKIAGSGDDLHRLQNLVRVKSAGMVKFIGYVKDHEKLDLYQKATLMLNSSLKEGYGLTTIEANACGTCVVATDVPGLRDSIQRGVSGFLVPFNDSSAMAEVIDTFLENNTLRQKMQKQAIQWASQHTWENTCASTLQAIENMGVAA